VNAATRYRTPRSRATLTSRHNSSGVNARRFRLGSPSALILCTERNGLPPMRGSSHLQKPEIAARYSFNVFAENCSRGSRARHASNEFAVMSRKTTQLHSRISRRSFNSSSRTYFLSQRCPRLISMYSPMHFFTDSLAASRSLLLGPRPAWSRSTNVTTCFPTSGALFRS
jgi:hypothetical protein